MTGTIPGNPARQNLPAFRDVLPQTRCVFIIDILLLVDAEITGFALDPPFFFGGALLGACGHDSLSCRWETVEPEARPYIRRRGDDPQKGGIWRGFDARPGPRIPQGPPAVYRKEHAIATPADRPSLQV